MTRHSPRIVSHSCTTTRSRTQKTALFHGCVVFRVTLIPKNVDNLPRTSHSIVHRIPYADVVTSKLPEVRDIFGRFRERNVPWEALDVRDRPNKPSH